MTPITAAKYGRFFCQLGNGTMDVNPSWTLNACWTEDRDQDTDCDGEHIVDQDTEWLHISLPIILANKTRNGEHSYFARICKIEPCEIKS